MRIPILMIALVCATATAYAGEKSGVTMPDTMTVASRPLVLNGMGLREATWLKVDVYVGGLYLEAPSSDAPAIIASNQTKVLVLKFVRDVGQGDIVKAWSEGFQKNATVPLPRIKQQIDLMNSWMPKFHDGDTLVFAYIPSEGVSIEINGVRKGTIKDPDFARSVFSIWLGPKPPTGALKKGLLGNHRVAS